MKQSNEGSSSLAADLRMAAKIITDAADELESSDKQNGPKAGIELEDVRKILAAKSRVSKENTDDIRKLLIKHGADRLSKVDPKEYESLIAEAEVLPDA